MPSGRNAISNMAGIVARAACFVVGTLLFSSVSAHASEVVTLADNTQIAGKLTHYFDGIVVIETSGGQKLELPRDKIKSITFKLPPPRAEFSTPEKTFERWRGAMVKGCLLYTSRSA